MVIRSCILAFSIRDLAKLLIRHSGLDPESRKCLMTLETGFRRYDGRRRTGNVMQCSQGGVGIDTAPPSGLHPGGCGSGTGLK
jgi:hypothetical protein